MKRGGIGVSPGIAIGPTRLVAPAPGVDHSEGPSTDPAGDGAAVKEAMTQVATDLEKAADSAPAPVQEILLTTAQLATDRGLHKAIVKKLEAGSGLTAAVDKAAGEYADILIGLGGYMAERATDLRDVRDRIICHLRGLPAPGIPTLETPSILVASDLSPAQTATLDPDMVLGMITEFGGPTSHTAILASQLGIPAIVRLADAVADLDGVEVAMDGGGGTIAINPTEEEQTEFTARAEARAKALENSAGPGLTKDGHAVPLLANIGTVADARKAADVDLEGSGLFRTEFLFLDRSEPPTLEEQTESYSSVRSFFGERKVVVRTLDAGADKPLAFVSTETEENPALGKRGMRLSQAHPDIFDTQLEALASSTGDGDLWVMAPMVATTKEAQWFADKARAAGITTCGVMIEVPSAALRARDILAHVDFASIGTNDLGQYTLAADRMNGELAELLTPWQPALLDLIAMTCEAGTELSKPIGICGEAAGDPLLALVLVGMGATTLSMAPAKVSAVRAALAHHTLDQCKELARLARQASDADAARAAVTDAVDPAIAALA